MLIIRWLIKTHENFCKFFAEKFGGLKNRPYICSPFEKNGQFIEKTERDNEVKVYRLISLLR